MADRVLVCGAIGFLGSHITERLLADGYRVRATWHKKFPPSGLMELTAWKNADLRDYHDCVRITRDIDAVFMCAAVTSGAAVSLDNFPCQQAHLLESPPQQLERR